MPCYQPFDLTYGPERPGPPLPCRPPLLCIFMTSLQELVHPLRSSINHPGTLNSPGEALNEPRAISHAAGCVPVKLRQHRSAGVSAERCGLRCGRR